MALWSRGEDRSDGEARILLQVLNDLTLPIFVIDAELSVLNMNDAARDLAAAHRGVWLLEGQLRAVRGEEQDGLVRIVGRVAGSASLSDCGFSLEVSADDDGPPLHLCVRPLAGGAGVARGSRMAVYVIDPRHQPDINGELLRRVYGLSPAEIRVTRELMQGHSAETIAEMLSISVYTVRTHLKNLFAKTGTKRQGELIARIAASLGSLRVPSDNHSYERCEPGADTLTSKSATSSPELGGTSHDS
jgi:DNA-binding CsgD family transcriptional regulator